jgi:TPR repeat protein
LTVVPGHAEKRVALVIGNSNYQHVGRLGNPANDAEALAALLKASGFDVVERRSDVGIAGMRRAIGDFSDIAADADIAIVYYAGHGIEVDGINYLIPTDARLARDFDVEDEAISLDRVLRAIDSARRLHLVILDACRENPFVQSMKRSIRAIGRGFARVEPTTPDTLVAFAAKAGSTASDGDGAHSPFTAALLKHIATPGLDIRLALGRVRDEVMQTTRPRQEPFVYGSLGGRTVLIFDAPAGSVPGAPIGAPLSSTEAAQAWAMVKDTTSIPVLETFIKRYGDGFYADIARARLDELKQQQPAAPQQQTEVAKDEVEAVRRYRRAAEVGDTDAMNNLGLMYANGRGVARDDVEAVRWYRKAVEAGNTVAMGNVGFMYANGRGVAKDDVEAVRWYRKAVEAGNALAMNNLGFMYRQGRGVAKDEVEAVRWYRKAAEAGNTDAMTSLGFMYEEGLGVAKDEVEAVRWYRKGAEAGNALAMNNLGFVYRQGLGVAKDEVEAVRWYRKGAEAGNALAMANLGFMYREGRGVSKDTRNAAVWVFKALQAGNESSYEQMTTHSDIWGIEFRRELQQLLANARVYDGPIDGKFSPAMKLALEKILPEEARAKVEADRRRTPAPASATSSNSTPWLLSAAAIFVTVSRLHARGGVFGTCGPTEQFDMAVHSRASAQATVDGGAMIRNSRHCTTRLGQPLPIFQLAGLGERTD